MLGPYGLSVLLRWSTQLNKTLSCTYSLSAYSLVYFQIFCSFTKILVTLLTCAIFLCVLVRSYVVSTYCKYFLPFCAYFFTCITILFKERKLCDKKIMDQFSKYKVCSLCAWQLTLMVNLTG